MNSPRRTASKRVYQQAVVDVPADFQLSDDVAALLADRANVQFARASSFVGQVACDSVNEDDFGA